LTTPKSLIGYALAQS